MAGVQVSGTWNVSETLKATRGCMAAMKALSVARSMNVQNGTAPFVHLSRFFYV